VDNNFDLVVLGTGAAASTVANRCRAAGWSVAIVDERPFGGTCQLRGCDPKKVMRRGAEVIDAARLFRGKGIAENGLRIDWPSLMSFKRSFTDPVSAIRKRPSPGGALRPSEAPRASLTRLRSQSMMIVYAPATS